VRRRRPPTSWSNPLSNDPTRSPRPLRGGADRFLHLRCPAAGGDDQHRIGQTRGEMRGHHVVTGTPNPHAPGTARSVPNRFGFPVGRCQGLPGRRWRSSRPERDGGPPIRPPGAMARRRRWCRARWDQRQNNCLPQRRAAEATPATPRSPDDQPAGRQRAQAAGARRRGEKQGEQCQYHGGVAGDDGRRGRTHRAAQGVAMLGVAPKFLSVAGNQQQRIVGARPNTSTLVIPDVAPSKARPVSEATAVPTAAATDQRIRSPAAEPTTTPASGKVAISSSATTDAVTRAR